MKGKLDWQNPKVVNVFDELTLWSAPFGRLLLENIPMGSKWNVVDLGFGTGFPLLELSQRFGTDSIIYGVDIWPAGIGKTREKMVVYGASNIQLFEQSASSIPLADNSVDLICSNVGVNNFEDRQKVYHECKRILKPGGHLALTTNPIGTFKELFDLFELVSQEFNNPALLQDIRNSVSRRGTEASITQELEAVGLSTTKQVADETSFRFVNAQALLDHSLIRIGFLESWENFIPEKLHQTFFRRLQEEIQKRIDAHGEFRITVPMLYLEFEKAA